MGGSRHPAGTPQEGRNLSDLHRQFLQCLHSALRNLLDLNGYTSTRSFTPDADIGTAAAHFDGGAVVPALRQQAHRVLPAGTLEDGRLSLLNVERAGEFYRVPGRPVQRGTAKEQFRARKVLVVGLIGAGVAVLALDSLPLQGAARRQR